MQGGTKKEMAGREGKGAMGRFEGEMVAATEVVLECWVSARKSR